MQALVTTCAKRIDIFCIRNLPGRQEGNISSWNELFRDTKAPTIRELNNVKPLFSGLSLSYFVMIYMWLW